MKWMWNPIVAPSRPGHPAAPVEGWRLWVALLVIAVAGALSLVRALQEPSTGYRFLADASARVQAVPTSAPGPVLRDVTAFLGSEARVDINAVSLTETGGIINRYDDQHRFYAHHRQIWQVLQSGSVRIEHAGGLAPATVAHKAVGELGLRFWFPWFTGLLSLSVGLGIWLYSPQRHAAACYLFSSLGYAFIMLMMAPSGSRLLTQPPWIWQGLHMSSHVAAFIFNGALAILLWNHPSRLGGRWFAPALLVWSLSWLAIDFLELVPTISVGFRLPTALFGVLFIALFMLQWRAARGDPVKRAQLKWLILLFMAGLSVVFLAYVFGASGAVITAPQVYGLAWISLLFLGLVPMVTRLGLFQLEAWWIRAWLWFLGGLIVVALDLVFLGLLSLQFESALLLAMAVGGWVYFPLRQVVWRRLSDGTRARTGDLLPDILALTSHTAGDSLLRRKDWLALWDRAFSPASMHETSDAPDVPRVDPQGRCLTVPGGDGLPALVLTLAGRGQRLFRPDDARRAAEIVRLVRTGLASHHSFEQGARQERQRIASDLHDDLGATLLSIAQTTAGPASTLARQAIEELRLSVRGLTGDAAPLADALADWRAETVSRLMAASIEVRWEAEGMPDDVHIPASLRTQLTRILREAVSNVIRHSGARHCRIELTLQDGVLQLQVHDDGQGMAGAADNAVVRRQAGMGLANMERRAHKLGGHYELAVSTMGGVHVQVRVPLDQSATIAAP